MINLRRRTTLAGLAALPLAAAPNVRAQTVDFPDRPLRLVVGFPPGGPNDLLARIVAPGIGERLKRSVVVENRAGANGAVLDHHGALQPLADARGHDAGEKIVRSAG